MVGSHASRERGTFLVMEPRDESLMRKAKVREILKTFQEEQPEEQKHPGLNSKLKRGQNQGSLDTK
jgi:hypothetical protein